VLEFSETLPEETDGYVEWMDANIDLLEGALQEMR
jgi:zinc/manganese transport system substrate-binding protein